MPRLFLDLRDCGLLLCEAILLGTLRFQLRPFYVSQSILCICRHALAAVLQLMSSLLLRDELLAVDALLLLLKLGALLPLYLLLLASLLSSNALLFLALEAGKMMMCVGEEEEKRDTGGSRKFDHQYRLFGPTRTALPPPSGHPPGA
jgi:hypothetical protein